MQTDCFYQDLPRELERVLQWGDKLEIAQLLMDIYTVFTLFKIQANPINPSKQAQMEEQGGQGPITFWQGPAPPHYFSAENKTIQK